jgi:hypothetical protein
MRAHQLHRHIIRNDLSDTVEPKIADALGKLRRTREQSPEFVDIRLVFAS